MSVSEVIRPAPPIIDLIHTRDHKFVKRKDAPTRCDICNAAKGNLVHHGTPPSLNITMQRSGAHARFAYQNLKDAWQQRMTELLVASDLPFNCGYILAEGQMCFPTRTRRDQGNYRFLIEKALGDALTKGGWLEDDSWTQYEFGRLRYAYMKDESWTALTLHPALEPVEDGSALTITDL